VTVTVHDVPDPVTLETNAPITVPLTVKLLAVNPICAALKVTVKLSDEKVLTVWPPISVMVAPGVGFAFAAEGSKPGNSSSKSSNFPNLKNTAVNQVRRSGAVILSLNGADFIDSAIMGFAVNYAPNLGRITTPVYNIFGVYVEV